MMTNQCTMEEKHDGIISNEKHSHRDSILSSFANLKEKLEQYENKEESV